MANGGARPGAGRKRKADKYARDINKAEGIIRDRLPDLIGNLMVLADGVKVEREDLDGNTFVYQTPPDRASNEYLINRIMGKPTEHIEQDTEVSGQVKVVNAAAVDAL